jgi:hypothetical protein
MGAIGPGHVDPLRCEEVGDGIVTSSPIPVGHSERLRCGCISRGLVWGRCRGELVNMFIQFFL